jgi:hypothetical protein
MLKLFFPLQALPARADGLLKSILFIIKVLLNFAF